jgi:glycine oxidase
MDVVVIGAGIIGSSIAWRLAQAGLRVELLDAGDLGGEASWAGAGMLSLGGELKRRNAWSGLALESLRLYPEFIRELKNESGSAIDYRQCGAIEIATNSEEWSQLFSQSAAQQEFGVPSRQMTETERKEAAPALRDDVTGALFYPEEATVNPRDVLGALRVVCTDRGVQIAERARVLDLQIGRHSVEISTENEMLSTKAAVLSAGAWSSQIRIWRNDVLIETPESFPVKGHLIGYQLKPGSLEFIVRHAQTYLLQRENGLTIAGSSEQDVGFDRRIDLAITKDIAARARDLLPGLIHAAPSSRWIGFRPATRRYEPQIGRLEDSNVWLAYGHYRNGILLAPATAKRIADEIISNSGRDSVAPAGSP